MTSIARVFLMFFVVVTCLLFKALVANGQVDAVGLGTTLTAPAASALGVGPTPAGGDMGLSEIAALALMVAAYAVRRLAPRAHWAHTEAAQWILPLAPGLFEAVARLVQAGAWSWRAVSYGALSYVLSWLIQDNTSQGKDQPDPARIQPPDAPAPPKAA